MVEELEYDDEIPRLDIDVAAVMLKTNEHVGSSLKIVFTAQGAETMRVFTGQNINKRIALLVGDEVICSPVVLDAMSDSALIDDGFTEDEARAIADRIMSY
jgi:preprotein translocase subunit SecD